MSFELKFILVTVSMILVDICWTMYMIKVNERKAFSAGVWGTMILIFGAFTTISYIGDYKLLIAAAIGSFIGTTGTVWYKNKTKDN